VVVDAAQISSAVSAVGNYSPWLPIVAGIAAGLSARAILAGIGKLRRSHAPKNFPTDPEALQSKFLSSFLELGSTQIEASNDLGDVLVPDKDETGLSLSLRSWEEYKRLTAQSKQNES
jgi:hypothetical protein